MLKRNLVCAYVIVQSTLGSKDFFFWAAKKNAYTVQPTNFRPVELGPGPKVRLQVGAPTSFGKEKLRIKLRKGK